MYFIKMLRKKYQETYIISKKKKVADLSKDVQEVSFLFQELFEEVKRQDNDIKTIAEEVNNTNNLINATELDVNKSNNTQSTYYILTGSLIGGGLGTLLLLYNPYVAIGTCICGTISGGIIGKFLK